MSTCKLLCVCVDMFLIEFALCLCACWLDAVVPVLYMWITDNSRPRGR